MKANIYYMVAGILLLFLAAWLYQMLFDPAANIPWFMLFLPIAGGLLFPKKLFFISPIILIAGAFVASLIVPTAAIRVTSTLTFGMGSWVLIFLIINPLLCYMGSTGHKDLFEWMYK